MEQQTETYYDSEIVLDDRKKILFFLVFLAICGCFFVLGYVLGNGAAQPSPVKYADAGIAGKSRANDNTGVESPKRVDEIFSRQIPPPSAIIEPPSTPRETAANVSASAQPEVFIPSVSTASKDKPVSEPDETSTRTVAASAEKSAVPLKQAVSENVAPPVKKPAAEKAAIPAKQTASSKVVYSVQVAAFRARREAETKVRELEAKGFESNIELPQAADDYYRIRVGRFASLSEATEMAGRLKKSGFETMIAVIKGN